MKKSKLFLSGFCLALALTFVGAPATKVFASDDSGPQGDSRSTQTTPQPPPPRNLLVDTLLALLGLL